MVFSVARAESRRARTKGADATTTRQASRERREGNSSAAAFVEGGSHAVLLSNNIA